MTWSEEQFEEIGRSALTLFEILGSRASSPGASIPGHSEALSGPIAEGHLEEWAKRLFPESPKALESRLAWDGLEYHEVAQALASPPRSSEQPWLQRLRISLAECSRVADELEEGGLRETGLWDKEAPAFHQLWCAFSRPVVHELRECVSEILTTSALDELERQLLRGLSSVAVMATHEALGERNATQHPRSVMSEILRDDLEGLLREYPVLARQLCLLCDTWLSSHLEWTSRLERDREQLEEHFGPGASSRVVRVGLGLSDRHAGGRQVIDLTFETGVRLAYKPRDVRLEARWRRLLEWLAHAGFERVPSAPRVLERQGYGWIEWVEPWQAESRNEVEAYFEGAGATLALAYLVSGSDLHMENVIAAAGGPVLIDGEALFQPEDAASVNGPAVLRDSFLATGLLSFHQIDAAGEVCDIGGLCGYGGYLSTTKKRRFVDLDEPGMRPVYESAYAEAGSNVVYLHGQAQSAADHKAELKRGFADCYRFLLRHREALTRKGGPLANLEGMPTRLVLRPTYLYGALQYRLATPEYQRDGVRRGMLIDALNRSFEPFAHSGQVPPLWPLVEEERDALEQLDVPYFTAPVEERRIETRDGVVVEGHLARSGREVVLGRIEGLSEEHLEVQLRLFDLALDAPPSLDLSVVPPSMDLSRLTELAGVERLIAEGARMAVEADRALGEGPAERLYELTLYEGSLGVALALGAAYSLTGDVAARNAALARAQSAVQFVERAGLSEDSRIGVLNGVGSLIYCGAALHGLVGDPSRLDLARSAAAALTDELIGADDSFDLEGGAAGAIVGLLALHAASPEPALLDQARRCGDHLLATATRVPLPGLEPGLAWDVGGSLTTGFAHGTAGIALALDRLCAAVGDPRYAEAATAALRFEHSRYDRDHRNWKLEASLSDEPVFMTAWCQGGTGIALGRALLGSRDEAASRDLENGVAATLRAELAPVDHLCCGNLGRSEALLVCGEASGRDHWIECARARAALVTKRAQLVGHFALSEDASAPALQPPGFFRGLAGVAFQLMRLAAPDRLPSVLAFAVRRYAVDQDSSEAVTGAGDAAGSQELDRSPMQETGDQSQRSDAESDQDRSAPGAVSGEGITYRALDADTAHHHATMTFPAYRHLLQLEPTTRHVDENDTREIIPFAIGAFDGDSLIGMALGEIPAEEKPVHGPELLSLMVRPTHRQRGIGTRLVGLVERICCNNGFRLVKTVYMSGREAIPWVEKILAARGWSAPEGRMVSVRFTPQSLAAAPWLHKFNKPRTHYEIFDWKDLLPEERQKLETSHAETPWIAEDLLPWKHDEFGFDEATSVGMRYKGEVVGWVIAHRLEPTVLRYTCSFMRKDLSRMARILPLYCESFSRLEAEGIETCMYATPLRHRGMIRFATKWFKPWSVFFGETRGAEKELPDDPAQLS